MSGDAGGDAEALVREIVGKNGAPANEDDVKAESGVDGSEQDGFSRSAGGGGEDSGFVGDGDKAWGTAS